MTTPYLPEDLREALADSQLDLFVGSGVSKAAGLPSWDDLISEMRVRFRNENTQWTPAQKQAFLETADHLEVAEVFKDTVGKHTFYSFLRRRFRSDTPLSRLHHVLKTLPIKTIFTTNYDKLLERCYCGKHGLQAPAIVYPGQLGYFAENETRIIKLHGDIDLPDSIVLTQTDYSEYAKRHSDFVMHLQDHVNSRTVLFIGFGLRDSNFLRIYGDARALFDTTKRRAYAVMKGANPVERSLWEKDGLRILPVNHHGQVATVLKRLRDSVTSGC